MDNTCKKKLLICGTNGFLGSEAVQFFSNSWDVLRLKRQSKAPAAGIIRNSHFSEDIRQNGVPDVVLYCNTCYGKNNETNSEILTANILFGLDLLQKCIDNKILNFVNINTALPRDLNAYSLSKHQFSEWGKFYANNHKMNFIDLHCEIFYGSGNHDDVVTYLIREMKNNSPEIKLTEGYQERDFIFIEDLLSAINTILDHLDRCNGYFPIPVGSGTTATIRTLSTLIHSLTHSRSELIFGAVPYRNNEVMKSNSDISFLRQLGWMPRFSLYDGLKHTIEGMK